MYLARRRYLTGSSHYFQLETHFPLWSMTVKPDDEWTTSAWLAPWLAGVHSAQRALATLGVHSSQHASAGPSASPLAWISKCNKTWTSLRLRKTRRKGRTS